MATPRTERLLLRIEAVRARQADLIDRDPSRAVTPEPPAVAEGGARPAQRRAARDRSACRHWIPVAITTASQLTPGGLLAHLAASALWARRQPLTTTAIARASGLHPGTVRKELHRIPDVWTLEDRLWRPVATPVDVSRGELGDWGRVPSGDILDIRTSRNAMRDAQIAVLVSGLTWQGNSCWTTDLRGLTDRSLQTIRRSLRRLAAAGTIILTATIWGLQAKSP